MIFHEHESVFITVFVPDVNLKMIPKQINASGIVSG